MKLRARLALTTAAVLVPLAALLAWGEGEIRARTARDLLAREALASLDGDAQARCEASPEEWARSIQSGPSGGRPLPGPPPFGDPGRPPPRHSPPLDDANSQPPAPLLPPNRLDGVPPGKSLRVHLYPFDSELRPSVPSPPLDPSLVRAVKGGVAEAHLRREDGREGHDELLLRSPWATGPCAFILAVRPVAPTSSAPLFVWRAWVVTIAAVCLALLLVLGPMVARIRALAANVRASSRRRYAGRIEVSGDDEIADLATAFDEAAQEVRVHVEAQERREQTLRDFLANTTHDVMTPLTVLQGHLANMRDAVHDGAPVDRAALDAAMDEAIYMASLVHNLGVAARLEAGEPHLVRTKIDLGALVERCVSRHLPIARQHDVELAGAVPEDRLEVEGDETFLEQAFSNVILNAISHNRAGGHVAVIVSEAAADGFRVRVIDDGPAMSDADIARLETPGPVDPAERSARRDGHGLGLAITRRVAVLHGMKLTFTRADLGGLCVDIDGATTKRNPLAPT